MPRHRKSQSPSQSPFGSAGNVAPAPAGEPIPAGLAPLSPGLDLVPVLLAMNVVFGISQSLAGVTMSPFLMENSGEKERTYLFSFSSGLQMVAKIL